MAAPTAQNATTQPTDQIALWSDETADITGVRLRTTVPAITPVDLKLDYVTGGHETLIFLALQIERTRDKEIAIRALSSAVGIIFKQDRDLLGGTGKRLTLTNLDDPQHPVDTRADAEIVGGNFPGGEPLTAGDLKPYLGDIDELGSYYGVLFHAGIKRRTEKNRPAFNKNRISNVRSTVNGDLTIFVENSVLLSDAVLDTVYAAFNSFLANRMYLMSQTVRLVAGTYVGPALSFQNMFILLEDAGLGSLRIIKEAILKYAFIRRRFPEIISELNSANEAQKCIRRIQEGERPFCKAIYGNRFVPVAQNDIANLLGICKHTMSYTKATYRQFDGGNISERQEDIIREELEALGVDVTPISTE